MRPCRTIECHARCSLLSKKGISSLGIAERRSRRKWFRNDAQRRPAGVRRPSRGDGLSRHHPRRVARVNLAVDAGGRRAPRHTAGSILRGYAIPPETTTPVTVAPSHPRPDGDSHETMRESHADTSPQGTEELPTPGLAAGRTPEDAFVALYTELYDPLCRFAWRYLRSAPRAQELVHDVFLRVWMQRAHSIAPDPRLPSREYLYAAVRNTAIDAVRRARSERCALDRAAQGADDDATVASQLTDDSETLDLVASIQRAIDELPTRPREVLLLKWRYGLSNGEVAVKLGVALKTVEMHVTRAFASLRATLPPLLRRGPR